MHPVEQTRENLTEDARRSAVEHAKYDDGRAGTERERLEHEQLEEANESWPVFGAGPMTDGMAKGFAFGSVVGGVVGMLIALPFAFFLFPGISLGLRLAIFLVAGALAGGTAGAIYFGGRVPELDGELIDSDGRASDGTTLRDPDTDTMGRSRAHRHDER